MARQLIKAWQVQLLFLMKTRVAQPVKNPPAMQETLVWFLGQEVPPRRRDRLHTPVVAQMVKNPPPMWETWVQSLGWEDPLEEGMATHSSIHAWRILMDRGAWQATVHGILQARILEFPFPSPGDLPDPGIEPRSPTLEADTLTSEPPGKPCNSN